MINAKSKLLNYLRYAIDKDLTITFWILTVVFFLCIVWETIIELSTELLTELLTEHRYVFWLVILFIISIGLLFTFCYQYR